MEFKGMFLFGCGCYGEKAYRCFEKKVEGFIDNDPKKTRLGSFCGKKVTGLDDVLDKCHSASIMIAMRDYTDVANQLQSRGVRDYTIYIDDNDYIYKAIDNIDLENKRVAIFGVNEFTEALCRYVAQFTSKDNIVVTEKEIDRGNRKCCGFNLSKMSDNKDVDVVIITPGYLHTEYEYYCERIGINKKIINSIWKRKWFEDSILVKDLYGNDTSCIEESVLEFRDKRYEYTRMVNGCVDEMEMISPMFKKVEIETINRCNLNCAFCPVGSKRDTREFARMDSEMFYGIINQLVELGFDGKISLYSNNEPFLDERIIDFQEYAYKKLPAANHVLYTNGTLLTVDKLKNITPFLDELVIDNYGNNRELINSIKPVHEYCMSHPELWYKVKIVLRRPGQVLTSRGGDAPNRSKQILYPSLKCTLPWFQLIIRPTGELSTCCADAVGSRTVGDLKKQSIREAWFSKEFGEFREALSRGRGNVDKCRYCDTFNMF